ncbi:response regulator transcription factor [Limosilactobacillus equigenerosi]|uniref:Response regulator n=1 Tax=Limosilactobacillus equigenerosi DSM 18793 = JCM 14505 TaxID=1423742 RepID=A0A0R1UVE5_9LACO|nr:response regulator transcription factor [Limosilactobacillus equigenerosi]KRL94885.1 Response regulator [Limosilactobacillus equigenerosi DSM 18793 = JCM 14505]MCQ2569922.1 response regulator transcription factor [Limosilactobacillus sp.]
MRILMVEDNPSVTEMMGMFFKKENWDVTYANDGEVAVETFANAVQPFDMILLDLNLPKKDGMQVSAEIRKMSPTVPIVMLTARSSESDQVLGLEMGADDYVTKPFSPITLIARLKALYRRTQLVQPEAEPVADGLFDVQTENFKLNTKTREAYLNEKLIHDLTPKEFDLLRVMAMKPKQVFTREQLLEQVWNYEYMGDERTVDAHIKKLRQKIRAVGPQIIQTVWGVGYKFDDSDAK